VEDFEGGAGRARAAAGNSSEVNTFTIYRAYTQWAGFTLGEGDSIFSQGGYTYIAEPGRNSVAELRGSPLSLQQEFGISNPIYVVGSTSTSRAYALGSTSAGTGTATAIETTSNTTSTR